MNAQEIFEYIKQWIEREEKYEKTAIERGDVDLAKDCQRRIFTLKLLLGNIQ